MPRTRVPLPPSKIVIARRKFDDNLHPAHEGADRPIGGAISRFDPRPGPARSGPVGHASDSGRTDFRRKRGRARPPVENGANEPTVCGIRAGWFPPSPRHGGPPKLRSWSEAGQAEESCERLPPPFRQPTSDQSTFGTVEAADNQDQGGRGSTLGTSSPRPAPSSTTATTRRNQPG